MKNLITFSYRPFRTLVLLSIFFTTDCMSQNEPTKEYFPTIKNSQIKSFELKERVYDHAFILTNGDTWNLKLSIPKLQEDQKVPLVLALHWAGDGSTYKEFADCLAFPGFDFMNAIIIAPSANGGHWVEEQNEQKVIKLIKQASRHWPIDSEKIIVTGYSNGGIGSWHYAQKYPKLFATALPIAGYYKAEKIKIPVYALHGEQDELFNIQEIEASLEASIKKGSNITFKSIPAFTHYSACSYVEELRAMAKKMQEEVLQL